MRFASPPPHGPVYPERAPRALRGVLLLGAWEDPPMKPYVRARVMRALAGLPEPIVPSILGKRADMDARRAARYLRGLGYRPTIPLPYGVIGWTKA